MDMLIRLYMLDDTLDDKTMQEPALASVQVRKPIGPEHRLLTRWVEQHFHDGWASEVQVALGNRPITVYVAVAAQQLIGFACYDATARGFVGPIGLAAGWRGRGLGAKLLRACLHDMHHAGYGYAIAGAVGAAGFFHRAAGATEIDASSPGLYRGLLKP
jgi:ribosomal protein S18 acetylase RimI-like enzyme